MAKWSQQGLPSHHPASRLLQSCIFRSICRHHLAQQTLWQERRRRDSSSCFGLGSYHFVLLLQHWDLSHEKPAKSSLLLITAIRRTTRERAVHPPGQHMLMLATRSPRSGLVVESHDLRKGRGRRGEERSWEACDRPSTSYPYRGVMSRSSGFSETLTAGQQASQPSITRLKNRPRVFRWSLRMKSLGSSTSKNASCLRCCNGDRDDQATAASGWHCEWSLSEAEWPAAAVLQKVKCGAARATGHAWIASRRHVSLTVSDPHAEA